MLFADSGEDSSGRKIHLALSVDFRTSNTKRDDVQYYIY